VFVVDSKGKLVHSKMTREKTILIKNEDQISNLSVDLHILQQLRIFDESFGKTTFVHFERDEIHMLLFYVRDMVFCITCEQSLEAHRLLISQIK
jgi:hypothetical protein